VAFNKEIISGHRPSISAFFPNGDLAVMIDSRGYGSANYSTGKTALSSSASGGLLCNGEGDISYEWTNQEASKLSTTTTASSSSSTLELGEGFGIVCTVKPKIGLFLSLVMKCRGVHIMFSQELNHVSSFQSGRTLFGAELATPSSSSKSSKKSKGGIRALEHDAASLPPLTHSELISSLRASTSNL
jgi:hypothetical protein